MTSLIRHAAYPVILVGAMCANLWLWGAGFGLVVATYVPLTIGTLLIIGLEQILPYRSLWRPTPNEVAQDSTYLALVHVVLPKGLHALSVLLLVELWQAQHWPATGWWPHTWPVFPQTALMVLIVDLLRYWLHRISHEWEPLWRIHAVHHAPHRLYTLNVGRFHPLDKSLQFVFDALPFIALGVEESVLSLYFVWYAINGFFQHSNVDVQLGPLNYLVSGPELHRWHHSMLKEESNHNYGNHLIVWDVVFGTRYLPDRCAVGELGLVNRRYPSGFMAQLRAPFVAGLDTRTGEGS